MRSNGTSLTGNGFRDWILQRVSAVILFAYATCILSFIVLHPGMDYVTWRIFFANPFEKVFTVLAMLSVLIHAWVGLWTVSTDYLKCACLRLAFQFIVFIALVSMLIWGMMILWG